MKACLRTYGIIILFLFLTIIIWMNIYMGVSKSISEQSSELDVDGTKLDRIAQTINKLGESKLKDGIIENPEKCTLKNGYKLKKKTALIDSSDLKGLVFNVY